MNDVPLLRKRRMKPGKRIREPFIGKQLRALGQGEVAALPTGQPERDERALGLVPLDAEKACIYNSGAQSRYRSPRQIVEVHVHRPVHTAEDSHRKRYRSGAPEVQPEAILV